MKKLLTIFTMATLCGVVVATDSFADCDLGYTLQSSAPTSNGNGYQYKSHNGRNDSNADNDLSAGEWKVTWNNNGTLYGIASCNGDSGTSAQTTASSSAYNNSADGHYCWCMPTGWTPTGGTKQSLSAAWVYRDDDTTSSYCAQACASYCADYVGSRSGFRSAVFAVVGAPSPFGRCVANSIGINWGNSTGGTQSSTTCTYGGALATPAVAPEKRGYTFTGWVAQ